MGFPWQLWLLLDLMCLVELSKRAKGSLKANCRLSGDGCYDPGSMIS